MNKLPYEILHNIFKLFSNDRQNLFSFLFVNRNWCKIIIPILWSHPLFKPKLITVILSYLNKEDSIPRLDRNLRKEYNACRISNLHD